MNEGFYDVIVIGGGISGLTTAYRLLQHGPSLKILVLEAKGIEMQSFLRFRDIYNYSI
jgi:glycine/D-amino acid oxidase-like deaminating enzyme